MYTMENIVLQQVVAPSRSHAEVDAPLLSGPTLVAIVRAVTAGTETAQSTLLPSRYTPPSRPGVAEGWTLKRCTPPSRLFGANGLRTGPDGRIYIAQVTGSQISALDIDTGEVEAVSPKGGGIVAPDDMAFDATAG